MPVIKLTTFIKAPVQIVFDLSRSIDLHKLSMQHTGEQAIEGVTNGLINEGEFVTWQATHFYKQRQLKVLITQMQPYIFFKDEMLEGDFKTMQHEHHFKVVAGSTVMMDVFYFETPYSFLGRLANSIFLTRYMKKLLLERNRILKNMQKHNSGKLFCHMQLLTDKFVVLIQNYDHC